MGMYNKVIVNKKISVHFRLCFLGYGNIVKLTSFGSDIGVACAGNGCKHRCVKIVNNSQDCHFQSTG